jgi:PAS domain S-box-containing protein
MDRQRIGGSRGRQLVLLALLLALDCAMPAAAQLETWRGAVSRVRLLAENDAVRAELEARQLAAAMPVQATPADQARVWNLLARIEIYRGQDAQADRHARQAFDLAARHLDAAGQAEADLNMIWTAVRTGNIRALTTATVHSLSVLDGVARPDLLGEALLRSSMLYRRLGQIEDSVDVALNAMEIARRSKEPLVLLYAHQGLAIAYLQGEHFAEARTHLLRMRDLARAIPARRLEADALNSLGTATARLGDPAGGERLIRQAIVLYREAGGAAFLNLGLFGLATNLRQQQRYADAMPLLEQVVAGYEHNASPLGLWFALGGRSANHESLGQRASALADAERAYVVAGTIGLPGYLAESAQRMAELSAADGQHRKAYGYAREAIGLAAKAGRERTSERMQQLAQRYQSESKQREIDELTVRNARQGAVLRQNALERRWLWTLLGASIGAAAAIAWFLLRQRRARRTLELLNARLQRSQCDLQDQTRILQSVLDSMADGVLVADSQGALLLLNPAGAKMLGATDGLPTRAQCGPLAGPASPLAGAVRGEKSDAVEILVADAARAGGRWLSITARPLADKDGAVHGGVAVFSDVTASKAAVEEIRQLNVCLEQRVQASTAELRQQTRYLRTLIDALPQWIWLKDTGGRFLEVNQATARASGLSVRDMIGKSDREVYPEVLADAYRADDALAMARRERRTAEMEMTEPGGDSYWLEIDRLPVFDEDNALLGTVGVARNITAHKATTAAREAALAEARRLVRTRSEFMAQMSHELRTPLNGILGYAQVLGDDGALSERQRAGLAVIQHSGEHLLVLINDILDFAKMEAGKLSLRLEPFALAPFLHMLADIVRPRAEQKGVRCCVDIGRGLPAAVLGDGQRLRQVLLNLLSNAVKFTERGHVRLRVARVRGARLRFEVQDSGVGIGPDELERIFQPFEQAGAARQRMQGAGLGLSISRQLVRLMDGELHVASQCAGGSTFWFDLALAPADPAAALPVPDSGLDVAPAAAAAAPGDSPLPMPPPGEIEVLYQLARRGNMKDIARRAAYLRQLDAAYAPLAERLCRLAAGYQSKEILSLVEQHVERNPTS